MNIYETYTCLLKIYDTFKANFVRYFIELCQDILDFSSNGTKGIQHLLQDDVAICLILHCL